MHFLREACKRKPLEPSGLVYGRAATAITMCCLFLVYIGYLISQLYYDTPLIIQSQENLPQNNTPVDIYFCGEGSTITFNHCTYRKLNYDHVYIDDCEKHFKYKSLHTDPSEEQCYMFMGDEYGMAVTEDSDPNSVRSFNFYWTADNLDNLLKNEISVPTISVQLYDRAFNPHRPWGIGDSQRERDERLYLGQKAPWASCAVNQSVTVYYSPLKKKIIPPSDFRAFLGLTPTYIEINEAEIRQMEWPISGQTPIEYPERSTYQGEISVQISAQKISIQTETRQHTFLASIALAGGAYGLLTTLYVVLFGMNKLTPWGLVHNTASMISKARNGKDGKVNDIEHNDDENFNLEGENIQSRPGIFSHFSSPFSRRKNPRSLNRYSRRTNGSQQFFRNQGIDDEEINISRPDSPSKTDLIDKNDEILIANSRRKPTNISLQTLSTESHGSQSGSSLRQSEDKNLQATITRRPRYSDSDDESVNQQDRDSPKHRSDKRVKELEVRVDELEEILSQFFIDTSYLKDIRSKEKDHKKKPAS